MPGGKKKADALEKSFARQLGRLIKTLRRERKMTQAELAQTLGISRPSIHNWELGIYSPNTYNTARVFAVLDGTPLVLSLFSALNPPTQRDLTHDKESPLGPPPLPLSSS